jgi:hypothetical protein
MKRNPKISGLFPSQGQYVLDERPIRKNPLGEKSSWKNCIWLKDQLVKVHLVKRPVG